MAAALLAIAAPLSFTADNFPDCTPAPACYPNRRAPHHGSLLNGACVRTHARSRAHATLTLTRACLGAHQHSTLQQVVQRQGHVLALQA